MPTKLDAAKVEQAKVLKAQGMAQKDIARLLNTSPATISRLVGRSVLGDADIRDVERLAMAGNTYAAIAAIKNVSKRTVSRIVARSVGGSLKAADTRG